MEDTTAPVPADQAQVGNSDASTQREGGYHLPIANITRIMRKAIPRHAKISKEAKDVVQECVTEFLLFITSEASEKCSNEGRVTITGNDMIAAMRNLGFDNYIAPLELYLARYNEASRMAAAVAPSPSIASEQPHDMIEDALQHVPANGHSHTAINTQADIAPVGGLVLPEFPQMPDIQHILQSATTQNARMPTENS